MSDPVPPVVSASRNGNGGVIGSVRDVANNLIGTMPSGLLMVLVFCGSIMYFFFSSIRDVQVERIQAVVQVFQACVQRFPDITQPPPH